jgi:hypothetical protein
MNEKTIKDVIFYIASGLSLGFTLIVYAHSQFSTKDMVKRIEQVQDSNEVLLEKRLEKIENKLDSLLSLLYERAIKPNK